MAKAGGESARAWALLGALALLAGLRPVVGCDDPADPGAEVSAAIGRVLADTWPEVLEPATARALGEAEALVAAAEAWSAAEEGAGGEPEAARAEAQEAWRAAMEAWQALEPMQLGPAAASLEAVGGQDLRDRIYSWPSVNRCLVDQETTRGGWASPDHLPAASPEARGLAALETTLFSAPGENACPAQVDINADGSWAALEAEGVQARRAAHAAALARDLRSNLQALAEAWSPEGGDFAGQLARAGEPGSAYESPDEGLNAVFDALFYLESETKDQKLGGPLGLWACGSASCLGLVESPLAGGSNVWIAANLEGFRALFTGGEGQGMEDLLRELGRADLADALLGALDRADLAAAALELPVDQAAATDPEPALQLHAALGEVATLLKTEVATALVLRVPEEAAGDVD